MSDHTNQDGSLNEDQIMLYTHGIRKKIVGSIMENDKVPEDPKEIQVLAGVLNDMDRAAISVKKIRSDEKVADITNAGGAALVAKLLMQINPNNTRQVVFDNDTPVPVLTNDVPAPQLNPGETDIGTSSMNFEEFSKTNFPNTENT